MLPTLTQVLRKIEEMKTRNLSPEMFRTQLDTSIKTNLTILQSPDSKKINHAETKKIDVASHFILRAAYCRTEDLRRWFLAQEIRLFRHRLESVASNAATANNGANTYPLEAPDRANSTRRFLGRVVLVRWYILVVGPEWRQFTLFEFKFCDQVARPAAGETKYRVVQNPEYLQKYSEK